MGIINIVENVKKIHSEYVVFVNIGKSYYTYGRDSYITSYLDEIIKYLIGWKNSFINCIRDNIETNYFLYLEKLLSIK